MCKRIKWLGALHLGGCYHYTGQISSLQAPSTPRRVLVPTYGLLYCTKTQCSFPIMCPHHCQLSAVSFLGGTRGAEHCMQPGRASKQARLLPRGAESQRIYVASTFLLRPCKLTY